MNIVSISPFKFQNSFSIQHDIKNKYQHNYILSMKNQLNADVASFRGAALTPKGMGNASDMITNKLAMEIRELVRPAHEELTSKIKASFSDLIDKGWLTISPRLKKPYSICEKTTTTELFNKKAILQEMKDISGILLILEDRRAFSSVISKFIKMLKEKELIPEDVEYYRLPPIRKGKNKERFNSLDIEKVERLGDAADEVSEKQGTIFAIKPSRSGYSGLHFTVRNMDGTFSEIQIMTRAMYNLKEIENFFYKVKFGKAINPKYSYIEDILAPLKPLKNEEYLPEEEKKAHKALMDAIKEYTIDAYKERLIHPYVNRNNFLMPKNPLIAKYDFNKICKLKELIDKGEL